MTHTIIETYQEYSNKIGNRKAIYKAIVQAFDIQSAIYPGSHIDITPSFVIPKVTYVDNFKGAIRFFEQMDTIVDYIEQNKEYSDPCTISFLGKDYNQPLDIEEVDLIISQYAGFVGQATKKYLKVGGILLCNDSHGDATLAKFDTDFEFIGVVDRKNKIRKNNLDQYFILPKDKYIDLNIVKEKMRGVKYVVRAENYVFRRIQ